MRTLLILLALTTAAIAKEPDRTWITIGEMDVDSFNDLASLNHYLALARSKDYAAVERYLELKSQAKEHRLLRRGEEVYPVYFVPADRHPLYACYKLRGDPTCTWSVRR